MDTLTMPASWEDLPVPAAVNVGNPHVIFFCEDLEAVDCGRLGLMIETDPLFPERVNVNFAQVIGENHIRLIVWERGAGQIGREHVCTPVPNVNLVCSLMHE